MSTLISICSDLINSLHLNINPNDVLNACENIQSVENQSVWETILPQFCEKVLLETDEGEMDSLLPLLCENINRSFAFNSIKKIYIPNFSDPFDYTTYVKFKCLTQICCFDLLSLIINDTCDHPEAIIQFINKHN